MIVKEGQKWACRSCITGHRSSKCVHEERELFPIAKKGRPSNQCKSCQERRAADQPPDLAACTCQTKFRRPSKTPAGGSSSGVAQVSRMPMHDGNDAKRRRQSEGSTQGAVYNGMVGDPRYAGLPQYSNHRAYSTPSSAGSSRASSPSSSAFSSMSSASMPYPAMQAAYPMPYGYPPHQMPQGGYSHLPPLGAQPRNYEWPGYNQQQPEYPRPPAAAGQQAYPPEQGDPHALYKAMGVQSYPDFNYLLTTQQNGAAAITPRASDSQQQPAWPGSLPLPSSTAAAPSFVRDDHYNYPVPGIGQGQMQMPMQSAQLVQHHSQPTYGSSASYSQPIQTSASYSQTRTQPFVPSPAYNNNRHSDPTLRYRPETQPIKTESSSVRDEIDGADATTPTLNNRATWSQEDLSRSTSQPELPVPSVEKWQNSGPAPWTAQPQQQYQHSDNAPPQPVVQETAPAAVDTQASRLPLPHYNDLASFVGASQMNLSIPEDRKRKHSSTQAQA